MSAPIISIGSSCGYIDIIIGPMFSGKTSYILRELVIFSKLGSKVLYINHSLDNRTTESFSTHNPLIGNVSMFDMVKTDSLYSVRDLSKQYDIIGIDEAQFFNGLKDFVVEMTEKYGKRVIITSLSGNFKRKMFGEIFELIPLCDRLTKLSSFCQRCTLEKKIKEAHFSYRLVENESSNILIGANESYIPLCRECFLHYEKEENEKEKEEKKIKEK